MRDERIQVGSIVKLTNPGDWKIPKGWFLVVNKIFSWGIKGSGKSSLFELKDYPAQWDEIEFVNTEEFFQKTEEAKKKWEKLESLFF